LNYHKTQIFINQDDIDNHELYKSYGGCDGRPADIDWGDKTQIESYLIKRCICEILAPDVYLSGFEQVQVHYESKGPVSLNTIHEVLLRITCRITSGKTGIHGLLVTYEPNEYAYTVNQLEKAISDLVKEHIIKRSNMYKDVKRKRYYEYILPKNPTFETTTTQPWFDGRLI